MNRTFLQCAGWAISIGWLVIMAGVPEARGEGTVDLRENVVYALESSSLGAVLDHLEFYPVAAGLRIGRHIPGLTGQRIGPYTCYAREIGFTGQPEVYPYQVIVSTLVTFYNANGDETELENGAVSVSEVADGITITRISDEEATIGDEAPVILREVLPREGSDVLSREGIYTTLGPAPLRYGMSDQEVQAILAGEKFIRGGAQFYEATGEWVEDWTCTTAGLTLSFVLDRDSGKKTLRGISTLPGSRAESVRGVRLGHSESRARAAYPDQIDPRESTPGQVLVIGDLYEGLFLQIRDGVVESIYLGIGAE